MFTKRIILLGFGLILTILFAGLSHPQAVSAGATPFCPPVTSVTASSYYIPTAAIPSNAFDCDNSTEWNSGTDNPSTITAEFSTSQTFNGFEITTSALPAEDITYDFYGSNDGVTFTPITSAVIHIAEGVNTYPVINFSPIVTYSHLRVSAVGTTTTWIAINELRLQLECSPGSYDNGSGCVAADPGYYVPEAGATAQIACSPGFYQPNSEQISCLTAPLGRYVPTAGALSASLCLEGTYSDVEAAVSCQPAQPGYYVDFQGAAEQTACEPGFYQPFSGATSCLAADPGFYVPNSAATEQLACPAGTTSEAGATECNPLPPTYTFTGFFAPVDMSAMNVVKAGRAIPIKFSLNGDQGLDIMAAGYPASVAVICDNNAPLDTIEETVTAGSSSLSYDAATDEYTYVWKTNKSWANSCRTLTVMLDDGSVYQASFKFNK